MKKSDKTLEKVLSEKATKYADNVYPNTPDNMEDERQWQLCNEAYKQGYKDCLDMIKSNNSKKKEQKDFIDIGWQPVLKIGVKNKNGRIYDENAVEKILSDFKKRKIKYEGIWGEMGYIKGITKEDETDLSSTISLANVSHMSFDLKVEDDILKSKISIRNSHKYSKELLELIDNKGVVFRPRCLGQVNEDGVVNISEFITIDAISANDDSYKDIL